MGQLVGPCFGNGRHGQAELAHATPISERTFLETALVLTGLAGFKPAAQHCWFHAVLVEQLLLRLVDDVRLESAVRDARHEPIAISNVASRPHEHIAFLEACHGVAAGEHTFVSDGHKPALLRAEVL